MDVLDADCFVSSTFGGDLVGITAALATIQVCQDEEAQLRIYESGMDLKDAYNQLADSARLPTKCVGNPARLTFEFPSLEHRALFWQECIRDGTLFGYATHTTLSHTAPVTNKTIDTMQKSFKTLKKHWERPALALEGIPPRPVLALSSRR
jgi:acetylornithine/succinyldiaminopimelate/putrescine aminotransferase